MTPGNRLREAIAAEKPLKLLGVLNPYMALALERNGFRAAYLSGAGLSNFIYGVPDVGIVALDEVAAVARTITRISDLPLFVDVDTGWDDPKETVESLIAAGVAGMHIEDQTEDKRCGHLEGKSVVSADAMRARIEAACAGKKDDPQFLVMARTDALATDGPEAALARMKAYVEAGADAIFAEAVEDIEFYARVRKAIGPDIPLLANITEYGKSPLYSADQLAAQDVDIMLMPVSLARAMHGRLDDWLQRIGETGSTRFLVDEDFVRPRKTYYETIDYDPKRDNRDSVLKKLRKGRSS